MSKVTYRVTVAFPLGAPQKIAMSIAQVFPYIFLVPTYKVVRPFLSQDL